MAHITDTGSFYSEEFKNGVSSIFDILHNTHKREVTVWINEVQSVPTDSSYNALFGRGENQEYGVTNNVLTKYTIYCRVFYPKPNDEEKIRNLGLPSAEMIVRLKVDLSDMDKVLRASKIEVSNEIYSVISDSKLIGPFTHNYAEVWLKRNT